MVLALHTLAALAVASLARTVSAGEFAESPEPPTRHFPPDPEVIARTAKTAAALEWMAAVGLIGVGMVVICVLTLRLAKPRRLKVTRTRTPIGSAWIEAGRRVQLENSGPREDAELDE